jgi:hypothetical protein
MSERTYTKADLLDPKRRPEETLEQYRLRRATGNATLKLVLRGRPAQPRRT